MKAWLSVIVFSVFLMMGFTPASAENWATYTNYRFGAMADIPAESFVLKKSYADGVGNLWRTRDEKAQIAVYGTLQKNGTSLGAYRKAIINKAKRDGIQIHEQDASADRFSFVGENSGYVVYQKVIAAPDCQAAVFNRLYMSYPESQGQHYAQILKRVANSITIGLSAECENRVWIQIGSRKTLAEAIGFAQPYTSTYPGTKIFKSENGWYPIVLVWTKPDDAKQTLQRMKASGSIPHDSVLTYGKSFGDPVWQATRASDTHDATPKKRGDPPLLSGRDAIKECFAEDISVCNAIVNSHDIQDELKAKAYYKLGAIYFKDGKIEKSIDNFNNAIDLRDDYWAAYYGRGFNFYLSKEYEKAIADFDRVTEIKMDFYRAYLFQHYSYLSLYKFDEAILSITKAIDYAPNVNNKGEYSGYRASIYLLKLNFKKAIEDLNYALAFFPKKASYYELRGHAYKGLKDFKRAVENYERALKLFPPGEDSNRTKKSRAEVVMAMEAEKKLLDQKRETLLASLEQEWQQQCTGGPISGGDQKAAEIRIELGIAIAFEDFPEALKQIKALHGTCVARNAEDFYHAVVAYYRTCDIDRAAVAGREFEKAGGSPQYASEVSDLMKAISSGKKAGGCK